MKYFTPFVVLGVVLHAWVVQAVLPYDICKDGVTFKNHGTTYSVAGLSLPSTAYTSRDIISSQISYRYNICTPVPKVPPLCEAEDQGASAFKLTQDNDGKLVECTRLTSTTAPEVKLFDETNPAAGITITHKGGATCGDTTHTFIVHLVCSTNANTNIETEFVLPDDACTSRVVIQSRRACPVQCPVDSINGLCSSKGLCQYDMDAKKSRCFCYQGLAGSKCDQKPSAHPTSGLNSTQGILVFVIIALGIILGLALAFMWYLLRARVARDVPSVEGDVSSSHDNEASFIYSRPSPTQAFESEQTLFSVQ